MFVTNKKCVCSYCFQYRIRSNNLFSVNQLLLLSFAPEFGGLIRGNKDANREDENVIWFGRLVWKVLYTDIGMRKGTPARQIKTSKCICHMCVKEYDYMNVLICWKMVMMSMRFFVIRISIDWSVGARVPSCRQISVQFLNRVWCHCFFDHESIEDDAVVFTGVGCELKSCF